MGRAFRIEDYAANTTPDAAAMAAEIMQYKPATDADALKLLRANFAGAPLSMRVAALDLLMRGRWRRGMRLPR
jgi:hypothetical protein